MARHVGVDRVVAELLPEDKAHQVHLLQAEAKRWEWCLRQETAACSEMVIFGDFNKSAKLPEGAEVPIEFTPDKPGEHDFACQMGMLRGKVIAE